MKIKSVFLMEMGCLKLTYNQLETPLKVVYRADEQQEKVVQRFLSVDPLAEKYPNISSFAYCANNPIMLIDPDGREVKNTQSLTDKPVGEGAVLKNNNINEQPFQSESIMTHIDIPEVTVTAERSQTNASSSGGNELQRYDWKNDNIWQGTKVWFKHIEQGGKPSGTDYYNATDLYKNYPISLWSGDAFGGSAKTRTNTAGISITIHNTNPDYYSANNIGYISTSSDIDLENGVYRIWGKHPQNNNSVISVSFGNSSAYERWRKYIFGN